MEDVAFRSRPLNDSRLAEGISTVAPACNAFPLDSCPGIACVPTTVSEGRCVISYLPTCNKEQDAQS